jgi:hypothetical protein
MRDAPAGGHDVRGMPVPRRDSDGSHDRAYRRARRGDQGRPAVLAWFVGFGIHLALVVLLVL